MQELPEYQRIAAMILISRNPSIDEGEITTNLKLRRKAIEAKYAKAIDDTYLRLDDISRDNYADFPVVTYL